MKHCEFFEKKRPFSKESDCEAIHEQKNNSQSSKNAFYKAVGIVLAAIILIIVLILIFSGSKLDAFDYLSVSFEGVNTRGTVKTELNKKALISNIIGEEPNEIEFAKYIAWQENYDIYKNSIKISFPEYLNLSNGDKIKITIDVSGKAVSKIAGGQKEYIVTGLPEVELIDVFEHIKIETIGITGNGSLKITPNTSNEFVKVCSFTVNEDHNLSNGDEVTINVEYDTAEAIRLGFAPKSTTKTITISGLSNYATIPSQLPTELIKTFANKFLKEEKNKELDMFSYSDFKYYNSWFCVQKEGASYNNTHNMLRICVSYKEYLRGEYRRTIYSFLDFKNILIDPTGKVSLKYEEGINGTFATDIGKSLTKLKEDYIVSVVK